MTPAAANLALAAGAVAGFAAITYGGVGTVLVSRSHGAHNVGQLGQSPQTPQAETATTHFTSAHLSTHCSATVASRALTISS